MRYDRRIFILLILALTACQNTTITPTNQALLRQPTPMILASVTSTIPSTIAASPTVASSPEAPLILTQTATPFLPIPVDLSRFDVDLNPPIVVSHQLPLIITPGETTALKFSFWCNYLSQALDLHCSLTAELYLSDGQDDDFTILPLEKEAGGEESWVAELPETNNKGPSLRYYIQVNDPETGVDVRYPVDGTIDLFVASKLIQVALPAQEPPKPGEIALDLPWGDDPDAVGLQKRAGYPFPEGPLALAVADDGRIALLDHVNERVLIFDPAKDKFSTILLPFSLHNQGNIQFDRNGQVAVFDPVGEPLDQSTVNIPRLYRFTPDGQPGASAPVFARIPAWLTKDMKIVDLDDSRLVVPFDSSGTANPRESQRQKQSSELLVKYMTGSVNQARLADVQQGIAFEVHSASPLGAIIAFERIPQGYVAVFKTDQIRAVWLDPSGNVLNDATLPNPQYSDMNALGKAAIDENGSLYLLGSTPNGIIIQFVKAPGIVECSWTCSPSAWGFQLPV